MKNRSVYIHFWCVRMCECLCMHAKLAKLSCVLTTSTMMVEFTVNFPQTDWK